MERDLTPKIVFPNPFGDGSTGSGLPEQSYIGDPLPTPSAPPSWVIPVGKVTPLGGEPEPVSEPPDYTPELAALTKTLDRIGQELAALREEVAKLARKRRRK